MAAPAAIAIVNPYPNQSRGDVLAPVNDVLIFDAGSDTGLIPYLGSFFMVTVDSTVSVVTYGGTTLTFAAKASFCYPIRVKQLNATGTNLNGGLFIVGHSAGT